MSALALLQNISNEADYLMTPQGPVPKHCNEFWTAKQRQMHSLHYANSYRASFKPELPFGFSPLPTAHYSTFQR